MLRRGWFPRGGGRDAGDSLAGPDGRGSACGAARADDAALERFAQNLGPCANCPAFVEAVNRPAGGRPPAASATVNQGRCRAASAWRAGADLCRVAPGRAIGRRPVSQSRTPPAGSARTAAGARPDLDFPMGGRAQTASRLLWSSDRPDLCDRRSLSDVPRGCRDESDPSRGAALLDARHDSPRHGVRRPGARPRLPGAVGPQPRCALRRAARDIAGPIEIVWRAGAGGRDLDANPRPCFAPTSAARARRMWCWKRKIRRATGGGSDPP